MVQSSAECTGPSFSCTTEKVYAQKMANFESKS